jgi:hypothetical protein
MPEARYRRIANREERLVEAAELFAGSVEKLVECLCHCHGRSQNGFVAEVHGRRPQMAQTVVVPQLLDVEKVLLSTMPRKADGTVDVNAVNTWTSSDPSVGVEVGTGTFDFDDGANGTVTCPGSFNCFALTPGTNGAGTVTSKIPGYEDVDFTITYAPGVPRSQNPSVGQPVSDL